LESQDRVLGGDTKKNGGSGSIYRDNGGNVKEKKKKKMGNATQKKYKQQREKKYNQIDWSHKLYSVGIARSGFRRRHEKKWGVGVDLQG
jgi:hypothetical protein